MKKVSEFIGKYMAWIVLAIATVPGAIFSVWHNISGAILAGILN